MKIKTHAKSSLSNYKPYYEDMKDKLMTTSKATERKASSKRVIYRTTAKVTRKAAPVSRSKQTKTSTPILNKLKSLNSSVDLAFNSVVNKIKSLSKKGKKPTNLDRENAKKQRNSAILGIGSLLVVVSIVYSTSVIFVGVGSLESKIALLPQVVFASFTLVKAFSKLYK